MHKDPPEESNFMTLIRMFTYCIIVWGMIWILQPRNISLRQHIVLRVMVKEKCNIYSHMSRSTTKLAKLHVHPAKSQIGLGISQNNRKRDPFETQHPQFEYSRLGFIESVHGHHAA